MGLEDLSAHLVKGRAKDEAQRHHTTLQSTERHFHKSKYAHFKLSKTAVIVVFIPEKKILRLPHYWIQKGPNKANIMVSTLPFSNQRDDRKR